MKNYKFKIIYIVLFCLILIYPIGCKIFDIKNDLYGVEYETKLKNFNIDNLLNFSFQNSLDSYLTQKIPGKAILTRVRNQILYSIFKVPTNNSLNISKKGSIMADEVMNYYNHGLHYVDDEYIEQFINKLNQLNQLLKKNGADLVLFITPTKARYFENDEILVDSIISNNTTFDNEYNELPYNKLIKNLSKTNIKYYDCIEYIENNNRDFFDNKIPLYYNTGHHWSVAIGNKIGIDFLNYVSNNTKVKFSKLSQSVSKVDTPVFPDSDIHDLFNIISKPKEDYYDSKIVIDDPSHSTSNIIIRGGSFLGQVPFVNAMFDENSNVIYMSNTDMFTDNWSNLTTINDYNECDFTKYTKDIDLIILEINEVNVYNATFGFLDYLLDNKDKLFN